MSKRAIITILAIVGVGAVLLGGLYTVLNQVRDRKKTFPAGLEIRKADTPDADRGRDRGARGKTPGKEPRRPL